MKVILFLFCAVLSCFSSKALAQEVEIEVNPKEPLVGETFSLNLKIKTNTNQDPDISFNPHGAEVVGKQDQGVSVRTLFINGRLITSKELNFSYELIAQRAGVVRINDIVIEVDGQTIKKPGLNINILKEPKQLPPVFALAIADKNNIFIGEGVTVRYYLYYKTGLAATDIKDFPKLTRFFKRFLQENNHPERVEYEGEVYERSLVYSARLFADKEGKFFADPITLRVQYQERLRQSPFGSLGLGFGGKLTQRTVSSKPLEIVVKKLPAENVPAHFTGLVGKHSFDLNFTKNKFLVNEPVEFKLKVTGPGNLENFDAPKIIQDPNFEEFETNADLNIETDVTATKVFDYTFLARGKTSLKAGQVPLSYFNPETLQYVTVNINQPELIIEGDGQPIPPKETPPAQAELTLKVPEIFNSKAPKVGQKLSAVAPIFDFKANDKIIIRWVNLVLSFLLLISMFYIFNPWREKSGLKRSEVALKKIQKQGLNYQTLHEFLDSVSLDLHQTSYQNWEILTQNTSLSEPSKRYFKNLLDEMEKKEFYDKKISMKTGFDKKAFAELTSASKTI